MATTDRRPIQTVFLFAVGVMLYGCASVPMEVVKTDSPSATTAALATALPRVLPLEQTTLPPTATKRLPTETPYEAVPRSVLTAEVPSCGNEKVDEYLGVILPLADHHVLDSKQAEKMSDLNLDQRETYRQAAEERLSSIKKITPPTCLQTAHAKLVSAFERLVQVWDYGLKADFENSRLTLIASYNEIVEVTAELAGYR